MRQTSLQAYWSLTNLQISKRQREVLHALNAIAPACNRQVSEYSGIPINVVTPRMNELVKKKIVVEAYQGFDITGKRVMFWELAQ